MNISGSLQLKCLDEAERGRIRTVTLPQRRRQASKRVPRSRNSMVGGRKVLLSIAVLTGLGFDGVLGGQHPPEKKI